MIRKICFSLEEMMENLHFLDHHLHLTFEDLHDLQLCTNDIQKFQPFSKDTIAIWTEVDAILEQSKQPKSNHLANHHQTQCVETVKQTNEIDQLINIDALDISFKSNESFESLNWTLNSSNTERVSENGTKKINSILKLNFTLSK